MQGMKFSSAPSSVGYAPSTRPTGSRSRHWSKGWFALALMAMCAAAGSVALEAAPGQGRGRRRAHIDRELTPRLDSTDFARQERVIVTFRKGAKSRKLQQLRALGVQVDKDFGAIEAVAANIPRGLPMELAEQGVENERYEPPRHPEPRRQQMMPHRAPFSPLETLKPGGWARRSPQERGARPPRPITPPSVDLELSDAEPAELDEFPTAGKP